VSAYIHKYIYTLQTFDPRPEEEDGARGIRSSCKGLWKTYSWPSPSLNVPIYLPLDGPDFNVVAARTRCTNKSALALPLSFQDGNGALGSGKI
jgi:hypothetical protein